MLKIRLLSDIHLEITPLNKNRVVTSLHSCKDTVLVLAGDIGDPMSKDYEYFIDWVSNLYEQVFVISGNHEYYRRHDKFSMQEVEDSIHNITRKIPNVKYLQKEAYNYKGIRFLGCTLWSLPDPQITYKLNDFHLIPQANVQLIYDIHRDHVAWLQKELAKDIEPTVVITHHLPSHKMNAPKYVDHPLKSFVASDNDELVKKANYWLAGHTHQAHTTILNGCKCYVNPIGYTGEVTNYNPYLIINLSNK